MVTGDSRTQGLRIGGFRLVLTVDSASGTLGPPLTHSFGIEWMATPLTSEDIYSHYSL
jgi:hypothetical protein